MRVGGGVEDGSWSGGGVGTVVVGALEEDLKVVPGEMIRENHNLRDRRKPTSRGLSSVHTKHLRRWNKRQEYARQWWPTPLIPAQRQADF